MTPGALHPKALLVGASCTAELIQDDPGGLTEGMDLHVPVVPLELPSYQKKEHWGAAETFYQIVRRLSQPVERTEGAPRANILGPCALGFRHRDDVKEIRGCWNAGIASMWSPRSARRPTTSRGSRTPISTSCSIPRSARARRAGWRSITASPTPRRSHRRRRHARVRREVAGLAGVDPAALLADEPTNMPWWSRSVDSTYLTGKRVFVFGDATHAVAMARVAEEEMGFEVVGLGAYNREYARDIRRRPSATASSR
jgi:light-independent protochlorophyllide reductase subunit B